MISLTQLLTQKTETECLDYIIETLADFGFNVTSWQSGSVQLTLFRLVALIWSDLTGLVATIVAMCFNETSTGDALTAFSKSVYDNTRIAATRTTGELVLVDTWLTGPHDIAVGAYVYKDTTYGYTYRNTTGGTITLGGQLPITIQAEIAGSARNVPNGTITDQVTPIAGVTASNPAIAGTTTWIASSGTDAETDVSLRERNRAKWPSLAVGSEPASAYVLWARSAAAGITRVKVDDANPDGPGTLDIYIAGPSGAAGGADKTAAQTVITANQPETAVGTVELAGEQAQAFSATVYVAAEHFDTGVIKAEKAAEILAAHAAYVNGLDIGGKVLPPPDGDGVTGYCLASEWQAAVTGVAGVEGIGSPSPSANVAIGGFGIMTVGTVTFTHVAVS